MDEALREQGRQAIARCLHWASTHDDEVAALVDLNAYYKALYFYAVLGDPIRGRKYADILTQRYQQPDGDFRTTAQERGWYTLPCSPANRYIYPNGWLILGLRRLGCYGAAARGMAFVRRFQSPALGGFHSRFDIASDAVDERYLDSSSTASAGLALLSCGHVEDARRAGDFIVTLLDAQPEPERFYYSSWEEGAGLMTDVWGDEDQNALRGRKQFCLSAEADARQELTWLVGKPMKFLAKLYDQTGDRAYLDGAIRLFDFFGRLPESKWDNLASCKIMWASAELYRHTGERRFADASERLLRRFCETQDESGTWLHELWYQRVEDQPFAMHLDVVQELGGEIADTLFDLSRG
ncbi:MAG: hypothetical protein QM804_14580 [Propionicimonas sp.]